LQREQIELSQVCYDGTNFYTVRSLGRSILETRIAFGHWPCEEELPLARFEAVCGKRYTSP
jgi:hypothetical protein